MREIVFRGYTGRNWQYGYLIDKEAIRNFDQNGLPVSTYIVLKKTIGQYTGLKDKNGTKIFEGDIIKRLDGKLYVIRYSYGGFDAEPIEEFYKRPKITWNTLGEMQNALWTTDNCEVIGNIHDNPELLEGV